jgi:hypothetical protein
MNGNPTCEKRAAVAVLGRTAGAQEVVRVRIQNHLCPSAVAGRLTRSAVHFIRVHILLFDSLDEGAHFYCLLPAAVHRGQSISISPPNYGERASAKRLKNPLQISSTLGGLLAEPSFLPPLVRATTMFHSGTTMQTLLCRPFA